MQDSPADNPTVKAAFESALQAIAADAPLCVAFSGGRDSAVLLHLAVQFKSRTLRAIHVNHGLHPDAADWAEHCQRFATALGVPLTVLQVTVAPDHDQGLEAAAREARYLALHEHLQHGEVLLTAHHQQDQLETYLLQLLRGAGVTGLAAMPLLQERAGIQHLRPLLDVSAAEVYEYADEHQLPWQEDPSNKDEQYDRNFLRHSVIPQLMERWPAADRVVARAARLSARASRLLDDLADMDLAGHTGLQWVDLTALQNLSLDRQANAIRFCIRAWGLALPSEAQLMQALRNLVEAAEDRQPEGSWPGVRVRRFDDRLWFFQEAADPVVSMVNAPEEYRWLPDETLDMGQVRGKLQTDLVNAGGIADQWFSGALQVKFRQGGESLRPGSQAATRKLKKLLQESDIFPWMRCHIPLVYHEDQLIAVGDLWTDAAVMATAGQAGRRITWRNHAPIHPSSAL